MCSLDRVTMTLMIVSGVITDVINQNRAAIGTPDVMRGQMNFKRWSLTLRLKLAILLLEISPSIIPVDRFEISPFVTFDLDW